MCLIGMRYLEPPHIILRKGLIAGIEYPLLAENISDYMEKTLFFTSLLYLTTTDHKRAGFRWDRQWLVVNFKAGPILKELNLSLLLLKWHRQLRPFLKAGILKMVSHSRSGLVMPWTRELRQQCGYPLIWGNQVS